jgi:hypothetical protein
VTGLVSTYLPKSVATTTTLIDVRAETPIEKFSSTLSLTMALNTYCLLNSYIVVTYDSGVLTNNLDNVSC